MKADKLAEHLLHAVIMDRKTQFSLKHCEDLIREKIKEVAVAFFVHMAEPEEKVNDLSLLDEAYNNFEKEFLN
jgi:hypothetical protein